MTVTTLEKAADAKAATVEFRGLRRGSARPSPSTAST